MFAESYREASQADILAGMSLTNDQIARYSRQIIIPKMGGHAQERLLGSRVVLISSRDDLEEPLAYLVGAGVGISTYVCPDVTARSSDRYAKRCAT